MEKRNKVCAFFSNNLKPELHEIEEKHPDHLQSDTKGGKNGSNVIENMTGERDSEIVKEPIVSQQQNATMEQDQDEEQIEILASSLWNIAIAVMFQPYMSLKNSK